MKRAGWTRLRGGLDAVWEHSSGAQVQRAPHPTALWPWYGVPPGGGPMILAPSGRAFARLADCMAAVEVELRKAVTPP